jgi:general secretion pathway protein A
MYLEYWGLQKFPFESVPDPEFMYYSSEHEEALARLIYAVKRNKGAVLLTGEIGCGKTTLSRVFIQQLANSEYDIGLLINPSLEPVDFVREALYQVGLDPQAKSKSEMLKMLNERMIENMKINRTTLLIIDEAQLIYKETFEEIRLLLNFQLNDRYLLTLVLIGQPELRGIIWKRLGGKIASLPLRQWRKFTATPRAFPAGSTISAISPCLSDSA